MTAALDALSAAQENYYVSSAKEKQEQEKIEKAQGDSRVTHDQFLQLLVAQLSQQDPLNPVKDQDFIGQMSQLQALDQQIDMTKSMAELRDGMISSNGTLITAMNSLAADNRRLATELAAVIQSSSAGSQIQAASSMIGKYVVGSTDEGVEVTGQVQRANMKEGMTYVQLGTGEKLWLGAVTGVSSEPIEIE